MSESSSKRKIFKILIIFLLIFLPFIAIEAPGSFKEPKKIVYGKETLKESYFILTKFQSLTPQKLEVILTGYSSVPWQTDSDPYLTASGKRPKFGTVASNFLPFGTKILIPEIFGNQIFIVEDRMHPRFKDRVDIWFPSSDQAQKFGIKKAKIYIFSS